MRRLVCVYLAVSLSCRSSAPPVTGTPPKPSGTAMQPTTDPIVGGRPAVAFDGSAGTGEVGVALVEGRAAMGAAGAAAAGGGATELAPSDTRALLARLEPLPNLSGQHAPAIKAPSPPPPRTGSVQPIQFAITTGKRALDPGDAPHARPAPPPPAPLVKPEISPSGQIAKETEIRIRFSEPMVAVAAVGTNDRPVATITPKVDGTWRWIDTRVATFTSKTAYFPNATEYVVTVAAGTKAVSGATLAEPATQTFRTRPLTIVGALPHGVVRPDSAIVVQLDQAFDPAAIENYLRVVHGKRTLPYRIVTRAEVEASWSKNSSLVDPTGADFGKHFLAIAPVGTWPAGSEPQIVLAKGAPSKEGPLVSTDASYAAFTVARPFTVSGIVCDSEPRMHGRACPMRSYAAVQFSNAIDKTSYRSSKVQVAGEPFEDHEAYGDYVQVLVPDGVGRTAAVRIEDLVDIYGQPLVGPRGPSFTVARQRFDAFVSAPSGLRIIDPRWEIPQWIVRAEEVVALHVQVYQVAPSDYLAFEAWERKERPTPPGKLVHDKFHPVGARHGATLRTDLRPFLGPDGTGHLVAIVHAGPTTPQTGWTPKTAVWFQVSKLGTTVRTDGEHLNAFVQDITPGGFGKPIANATIAISVEGRGETQTRATDAQGHVELDLLDPDPKPKRGRAPTTVLQVTRGSDSMFTPFRGRHERAQRRNEARWYVTDDRFTYKPGERVYVKGWVRWTDSGVNPKLALPGASDSVAWTLADGRGNKIASGTAPLGDAGGFDLETDLPANTNLGTCTFTFATKTSSHRHPIAVQEFRRPAYAVNLNDDVTHAGAAHLILGESIEMAATAKYYAGGGLPAAPITWRAELARASYVPPGWSTYRFEPTTERSYRGVEAEKQTVLSGDSAATAVFAITQVSDQSPSVLTVDATVTDVDRMTIRAASRPILVHPSSLYVGARLKPETYDMLEFVVTDIDGNLVPGVDIAVAITGVLWSERGRDDAIPADTQTCKVKSAAAPVTCKLVRKGVWWQYKATAKIVDSRKRPSTTTLALPFYAPDRDDELVVIPDKPSYRPGEIAKLAIKSKQLPAIAYVSFARQGVIAQKRLELAQPTTTLELPIEPGFLQNVHVLVDRFADRRHRYDKVKQPLPEILSRAIDLDVDVESARLAMRTRALSPLVEPGERATFEVAVTHDGKPTANAEVALIVVDEAVLALSGKSHADPLEPFYRQVVDGTYQFDSLDLITDDGAELDGKPGFERYKLDTRITGAGGGSGYGSIGAGSYGTIGHGGGTGVVVSRKDFRATAAFSPRLKTDAHGKVRLTVTMPESLTRFRIVALATSDTRYFGKAESAIVTQRKVSARTIAPRFLNQGDRFSLPVVVQNLDASPRTVDIAVRAANLVAAGPQGKRVTLQSGQRTEVRFDFTTEARGRAVVQTIAVSGSFADASNVDIPVYEPATTEAFATYGIVDDAPKFERLEVPAEIFTDVGGVEVSMQSTQLAALTDAFWYLYAYPYECAEQRSSRMIATTAMADILEAFATPGRPSKAEIAEQANADLAKLAKDQNPDGGWGYFDGMRSDPFVTAQVLVALAGHKAPGAVLAKATKLVTKHATEYTAKLAAAAAKPGIERTDRAMYGTWVSLAAASFSALATVNVDVRARAEQLHATATALGRYPIDAKARLLAVVATRGAKPMRTKLLADLISAAHETAAAATITTTYAENERAVLVSEAKTTALALDAIMREAPAHALVPKLARGLLDKQRRGRWTSTQENLVVLQTMRRYFDTYEKAAPNFTGKLWFGAAAYTEQAFAGRSTAIGVAQVDWERLPAKTGHELAIQKDGPGRLYYRIGIVYAPKNTALPALDAGFVVRRTYTAIDDPADVTTRPDGSVSVRLGARIRVVVEAINSTDRHAVALVDPLPAGFEAVNEALAIAERTVPVQGTSHWDFRAHKDHQVEVFRMDLPAGRHQYAYTARATTPGSFLAAPTKAEEMYSPETFGRSTGTAVVIQ